MLRKWISPIFVEEVDTIHIFSQLPANVEVLDAASYEASKEMFNRSLDGSVTSIAGKIM